MADDILRVLLMGAHPDDCDSKAGGIAALYAQQGHVVKMVSLTNGDAGHYEMGGAPLAWRRRAEAKAAGECLGVEYITLDNHDGELLANLEVRRQVVRIIRAFSPDLVMSPRPWDYHPDHRVAGELVMDAIYLCTVPNIVSDVPHLRRMPVSLYFADGFQKPYPFEPDVAIDIGPVLEKKLDALHCHVSQMYEWLPYNRGELERVPEGEEPRREWLAELRMRQFEDQAERYRDLLVARYGQERGMEVRVAEAFEASEYGSPLTEENTKILFPF